MRAFARVGCLCGATLLSILSGLLPAAQASTVVRTDPRGDVPQATRDVIAARVSYGHRLRFRTSFVRAGRGTAYFGVADPGRRHRGDQFLLSVWLRRDGTTAGFFAHADNEVTPYEKVRCAALRTGVNEARNRVRVSVPARCLSRYGPLGRSAWVRVESAPVTGTSSDFLPDPPDRFRVPRG